MRIVSILLLLFIISCQSPAPAPTPQPEQEKLGIINIDFKGNEAAQPAFKKGLLLLHNFEFDDARDAFLEAQDLDSTMAMAYWGEAMTYNHPLWRQQEYDDGKAALAKLARQSEQGGSELERDFIQSLEVLYGEGEKKDRDIAYNKYLETLYKKHPGNEEVAAFYALSCLGAVRVGRDEKAYEKGAAIAQGILDENPNHPGALHYLIHSYDDPKHAPLALQAANSYSKVAADAAHALHMPSHIYVAVGMWDDVVRTNIASWEASLKRMEAKELDGKARSYHALHWLLYGYLQKGQYSKATKIMEDMDDYLSTESFENMRGYLVAMKANYLIETNAWNSPIADYETDIEDLNIRAQMVYHYTNGVKAHRNKESQQLDDLIKKMGKDIAFAETMVSERGTPMCNAASTYKAPNRADVNQAKVILHELRALKAWSDKKEAESWLVKATELEDEINYSYGPPVIAQPSHELYGQWLLEQGRAEEAIVHFDKALYRGPKRVLALHGKLQGLEKSGQSAAAAALRSELRDLLKDAEREAVGKLLAAPKISQR